MNFCQKQHCSFVDYRQGVYNLCENKTVYEQNKQERMCVLNLAYQKNTREEKTMLSINMDDVVAVLVACRPYLIFFGVVFVLAIVAMVACKRAAKAKRKLVRAEAWLTTGLALVITINLICMGPMSTMISLVTGNGTITEETSEEASELCLDIAEEGIVLLENSEQLLPLQGVDKLNVFGWASINPCYGGTGSGALSDAFEVVTLEQGLTNAGFELNTKLADFYVNYRAERPYVGMWSQDWTLPEPPASTYDNALLENAKAFSDKAVIIITRVGGEGADLPMDVTTVDYTDNTEEYKDFEAGEHYLQLSKSERDMVELVCQNFDDVVLVYNGANAMELGFVEEYDQIKSVLWVPGTGQTGFDALGNVLAGTVNPSGKAADTFVRDLTTTPAYNNAGKFVYDNMDEFAGNAFGEDTVPTFVNYVEGIYVGYKFYETAADEGLINYYDEVLYPFGHGLSYTEFTQEMGAITESNGEISFDVTVTNVGNAEGKDVVGVYYNPPYTNGGIEKASANLVAFAKTDSLEPGETETLRITFHAEDMASYDEVNAKAYVLEEGEYKISIRKDSHNIIEEDAYQVAADIVYGIDNPRSSDAEVADNKFEFAAGDVTYLSRADQFANYDEATARPATMTMPEHQKELFVNNSNYDPSEHNDDSDVMPTTGARNNMQLSELRGAEYDDERWETLLDQLSVTEMDDLIAFGGYQTAAISSIGKVQTIDCDGPASINNNFTRVGSIGFPSAVMIANTWNAEIAEEFGESIGKMADEMGVSGWYAPAMNIHRTAFAGRNFEYYSEDGVLSGVMAANAVIGAEKAGVYSYLKHFALNDQEDHRLDMLCTWSTEQAIREIYLKPFEMAVKDGGADAIMSAFNYIGTIYAGALPELLNGVLREEWGFRGFVLTDYFGGYGYQNADQAIRNGNDIMLATYEGETNRVQDKESATGVLAMRQASKNILYTTVNSRAYAGDVTVNTLQNWQVAAIVINCILAAGFIAIQVKIVKNYKKRVANGEGVQSVVTESIKATE